MENCVFCKIINGEIPSEKVHESKNFLVIKDANPKTEGHSLILSKKHYETFFELPEDLYQEFLTTSKEATTKLLKETSSSGSNFAVNSGKEAGQLVPHFHLHILPRKIGDGFDLNI